MIKRADALGKMSSHLDRCVRIDGNSKWFDSQLIGPSSGLWKGDLLWYSRCYLVPHNHRNSILNIITSARYDAFDIWMVRRATLIKCYTQLKSCISLQQFTNLEKSIRRLKGESCPSRILSLCGLAFFRFSISFSKSLIRVRSS